jgi:type II secretory pathway component PulM
MTQFRNPREKWLLAAAAAIVLAFALDKTLWRPMQKQQTDVDKTLKAHMRVLARKKWLLAHEKEILKKYGPPPEERAQPAPAAGAGGSALLNHLAVLARQSGIKIRDLKPVQEKGAYSGASILFNSTWPPLARFLTSIEKPSGSLHVQKLTITRDAAKGLICQITVQTARKDE